jgi:3,4-dihydroxy 2-butanone 4-phosphate synthase / GTP cyclohydrolase II
MESSEFQFDTIEDALEDIRNGRLVIVVDDEDRENEGTSSRLAETITPEQVNFMTKHGRGLICAWSHPRACRRAGSPHDGGRQHVVA